MRCNDTSWQTMNIYKINCQFQIIEMSYLLSNTIWQHPQFYQGFHCLSSSSKHEREHWILSSVVHSKLSGLRLSSLKLAISSWRFVKLVSKLEIVSRAFSKLVSATQRCCLYGKGVLLWCCLYGKEVLLWCCLYGKEVLLWCCLYGKEVLLWCCFYRKEVLLFYDTGPCRIFLWSNSIFHFLFPPRSYSHIESFRFTCPSSHWCYSCHSATASDMHSGFFVHPCPLGPPTLFGRTSKFCI